jgi:apolipoprotein N-acyltransferase
MNRPAPPWRGALALGGGFLLAISLPPWGFWPLAIVGVALFHTAIDARSSWRLRALGGCLFGFGWLAVGTGWMWQLTVPGYVVAALVFSAMHTVAAVLTPSGPWQILGRPAAHALVEALRLSFPFGGVPLASLGISQVAGPLGGTARVVGVIGLTWLVLQLGVLAAELVRMLIARVRADAAITQPAPPWVQLVIAACAVTLLVLAAPVAPRGVPTGDSLTVAAVQGGGRQGTTALDVPTRLVTERHLEATASIPAGTIPAGTGLDLVLWPENVVRVREVPFAGSEVAAEIAEQAARLGVPIAVGITEDADATGRGQRGQITNAQVVVTPNGEVTSRYDKVRRVPFGEYVPLRDLLERLGAPVGQVRTDAVPGTAPAFLDLPDQTRLAVVISWEVFFGGRARDGVKAGGQAIINPTNGASYTGTIVQTQQVASSRLRAIETGRWVVQAAPTGFSAFVSPDGEVIQRTAVSEQRVITAEVPLRTGHTWYTRVGDGPLIWILAVALATAHLLSRRQVSEIDDHGDGTVVDQLHAHVGPEPAGGNLGPQSL